MHTVETDWWLLDLPEEWQAEQDEETIVIGDEDGVGVLEITALEGAEGADLQQLAQQLMPEGLAGAAARIGDFTGLYFHYEDDGDAVREWLVRSEQCVLLLSYSCEIEDAGMDDALVDEVLETLTLKRTEH